MSCVLLYSVRACSGRGRCWARALLGARQKPKRTLNMDRSTLECCVPVLTGVCREQPRAVGSSVCVSVCCVSLLHHTRTGLHRSHDTYGTVGLEAESLQNFSKPEPPKTSLARRRAGG